MLLRIFCNGTKLGSYMNPTQFAFILQANFAFVMQSFLEPSQSKLKSKMLQMPVVVFRVYDGSAAKTMRNYYLAV